ncbi:TPA: CmeU family protein, partial [Campylobacter coli]
KQFYHLDYAMRKLLPAIYKAYEVSDSDLNRDF